MGANMMLTIGAILLFGIFLSTTNKLMIGNNQIASQNEYYIAGISMAQSVIDEAKSKAFDKNTAGQDTMVAVANLTAPGSLGRDAGEGTFSYPDTLNSFAPFTPAYKGYYSAALYNDVDDYNNYVRVVTSNRSARNLTIAEGYRLSATVRYGDPLNPNSVSAARSYCKVMTVKVTSPYFRKNRENGGPDTLTLQYAFTY
ncbi:MAG TPA: hypothetical protein VL633_00580 [Bacteroidota bacterium]|jgi:hypothetical protein|nr:hypothetical protein [Bacteroidota bacterium]